MGSLRVGYDCVISLSLFTFMHGRRKWQPTPVFLPEESQMGEPGGLPSMGSHRVGHELRDLAAAAAIEKLNPGKTNWPAPKRRKVMTNLDSIFKNRDITLSTKVCLVKAMVFPVVMYGCESWTIRTAEHRRIDALEPWCWRRLLRVPWTARRSNQSILKEISPGCS